MGMNADRAAELAKMLGYKHYHDFAAEEWFPERRLWVEGFFIDQYEVTVERWEKFVRAGQYKSDDKRRRYPQAKNPGGFDIFPATRILWAEAQKYANFMGKALPTERQWEKAARGTDGRFFPWGNAPPTDEYGAFPKSAGGKDAPNKPHHVGSTPKGASPYGCMDMAGNVYEWTSQWHEPYPNNPEFKRLIGYMGHENGCLRGGSFYHARHALAAAKRFGFKPDETYYHVGFRTVWEPPADYFTSDAFKQAQAAVAERDAWIREARQRAENVPTYW